MLAIGDKAAMSGFVLLADRLALTQRWSDNSPGTQAQALEIGTCGSDQPKMDPFFQWESRVPCLVQHRVQVVQVQQLHHHQSVQTETPLWTPSPH